MTSQRNAAGVVGMVVFVAAVLIVGTVGLSDRTQGRAGGVETGPVETRPVVTRPVETGPTLTTVTGPTVHRGGGFDGLPPEGAEPSSPEQGELIAKVRSLHVGSTYVYADGRVISWSEGQEPYGYREQRLTPEGVDLVRSGAIQAKDLFRPHRVPASVWGPNRTMRPYVPYRYAICQAYGTLNDLPAAGADLLRGKLRTFDVGMGGPGWDCYDVTTEQARALDWILIDAGFLDGTELFERAALVDVKRLADGDPLAWVSLYPVLPHGAITHQLG